jgi:hypothetical protein
MRQPGTYLDIQLRLDWHLVIEDPIPEKPDAVPSKVPARSHVVDCRIEPGT